MKVTDTQDYRAKPFWQRWAQRFAIYAEAFETSIDEHQNRRISALEVEVDALRQLLSDRS